MENLSPILMDACSKTKFEIEDGQIDFYRKLARHYMEKMELTTGVYWASKVVTFTSGEQQDVYQLAQFLFLSGQYLRAAHCIRFWHYEKTNLHFRCLYAKCLFFAKDYNKALCSLDFEYHSDLHYCQKSVKSQWEPSDYRKTVVGEIHLIRGKIYAALMNRSKAIENYKKCLELDIYCQEAFQLLSQYQMKSPDEMQQLVRDLPFSQCCAIGDDDFVQQLYTCGQQNDLKEVPRSAALAALNEDADVMTGRAEKYLTAGFVRQAYKIATKVYAMDPFHPLGLAVLIACQVELNMEIELFKISHKLVVEMPNTTLASYSIGAYYYCRGRQELARANLNKALSIDPVFGPAWLLFGHSFAADNEHDQSMAAYFKASQLMKGCHLPFLYGGVECALTKNTGMALEFIRDASKLSPNDPFIHHELGVILFHDGEYHSAFNQLHKAKRLLAKYDDEDKVFKNHWEPLYNNLGHCCRKLKNFKDALKYHRKALSLSPNNFRSYSAIAFILALNREYEKASDYFHKALSLNRDDAFSNSMLRSVMDMFTDSLDENLDCLEEYDSSPLQDEQAGSNSSSGTCCSGDEFLDTSFETSWFEKSIQSHIGNYQLLSTPMELSSALTVESDAEGDR